MSFSRRHCDLSIAGHNAFYNVCSGRKLSGCPGIGPSGFPVIRESLLRGTPRKSPITQGEQMVGGSADSKSYGHVYEKKEALGVTGG